MPREVKSWCIRASLSLITLMVDCTFYRLLPARGLGLNHLRWTKATTMMMIWEDLQTDSTDRPMAFSLSSEGRTGSSSRRVASQAIRNINIHAKRNRKGR
uniref:Putative secreted protein n=1 Tax=Anopheles marajoara TaxID=58244 RepID=A0A2M4C8W2_9DIPT